MAFVEQMARINRGRAFFAAPDRLGEYILVDYVRNKRRASKLTTARARSATSTMTALLDAVQIETGPSPRVAVIWMHGLGADGHDFEPIVPELDMPNGLATGSLPSRPMRPSPSTAAR